MARPPKALEKDIGERRLPIPRFSLQALIVFVGLMCLNLAPRTEKVYSGNVVATVGNQQRVDKVDRLVLERGWPFPYLIHTENVAFGTGDAQLRNGWPRNNTEVPCVTLFDWLIVDIVLCAVISLSGPYVVELLRNRATST